MMNFDIVEKALLQSWSLKTSSKWTAENPYKGQCGVTAIVIQEFFGGDIYKTMVGMQWHFYNYIDNKRIDFTRKQFENHIEYNDIKTTRSDAFTDTNSEQYNALKAAFSVYLKTI